MRISLIRAWQKNGAIPAEDLALILGMHYVDFVKIMTGEKEPGEGCREAFSQLFDEPVQALFPDSEQ